MTRSLTALTLFEELADRLDLRWVDSTADADWPAISANDLSSRPALAGFLNLIHVNRIQVLGNEELDYLQHLSDSERLQTIDTLLNTHPLALVVGDGRSMPTFIRERVNSACQVALLQSSLPAHELVNYLQYHVSRFLARSTTLHGVFMEVFTIGVHIMGEAGCGKSELALELLTRGHRLIADDAPEFTQISPEIIDGTCPQALQDCLEVRGLGVLNVRQMFGDATIKLNKYLRLIIRLELPEESQIRELHDRLHGDSSSLRVIELDIPCITLQVRAGRNLAVMIEAAVRDFMLKMRGYDAAAAFVERHARLLQEDSEGWRG